MLETTLPQRVVFLCKKRLRTVLQNVRRFSYARKEVFMEYSVLKSDDDKRLVFGWASVSVSVSGETIIDLQSDQIEPDDLETAVYQYVLNFRDGGEEHMPELR